LLTNVETPSDRNTNIWKLLPTKRGDLSVFPTFLAFFPPVNFMYLELQQWLINTLFTGKAIGLPDDFIASSSGNKGGGVIQVSTK
jgi:hypothetical protein